MPAASTEQLGGMTVGQLAELSKWGQHSSLRSAALAAMSKQLSGMTAGQLAELSKWGQHSSLRSAALAAMSKSFADLGLASFVAHDGILGRADHLALRDLLASAEACPSVDVAEVLRREAPGVLEDPAGWVAETEEAAEAGDTAARAALLLMQYLARSLLLLAEGLNPSAKNIERVGRLLALSVFLIVAVGTIEANSPKTLEKLNDFSSIPLAILTACATSWFGSTKQPRRNKPSLNRRGNSKPRTKVLQRVRHR